MVTALNLLPFNAILSSGKKREFTQQYIWRVGRAWNNTLKGYPESVQHLDKFFRVLDVVQDSYPGMVWVGCKKVTRLYVRVLVTLMIGLQRMLFLSIDYSLSSGGWVSIGTIVTHYGLDGQGIESWWGQDFPCCSRLALSST
jgi:hypothetical protein